MQFLTDFADQQVILPLTLLLALALAVAGWRRGALAWLAGTLATLGCVTVLKVAFIACGWRWTDGVLNSPSGHAASAALCYGGFALLVLRPSGAARAALLLVPPLLAVLVGVSRVVLHQHTPAEAVLGGAIGTAGAFLLPLLAGPPPQHLPLGRVLLPALVVLALLHGGRLRAEGPLRHFTLDGLWPPASCRTHDGAAWSRPSP
jgi:membrane-associated phospholipid phosphatase